MPGETFLLPFRPGLDANAIPIVGARLEFYVSRLDEPDSPGTTAPQAVYANEALTVSLGPVVEANGAGVWPTIYLDKAKTYRVILRSPDGQVLDEADPYVLGATDTLAPDVAANAAEASKSAGLAGTYATALATYTFGYIGINDPRPPIDIADGDGYIYTLNNRVYGATKSGDAGVPQFEILTAATYTAAGGLLQYVRTTPYSLLLGFDFGTNQSAAVNIGANDAFRGRGVLVVGGAGPKDRGNGTYLGNDGHPNWLVPQTSMPFGPTEFNIYGNATGGVATKTGPNTLTRVEGVPFNAIMAGKTLWFRGKPYGVGSVPNSDTLIINEELQDGTGAWNFPLTTGGGSCTVASNVITRVSGEPFVPTFPNTGFTFRLNGNPVPVTFGDSDTYNAQSPVANGNYTYDYYLDINAQIATLRLQKLAGNSEENLSLFARPDGYWITPTAANLGELQPVWLCSNYERVVEVHATDKFVSLGGMSGKEAARFVYLPNAVNYFEHYGNTAGGRVNIRARGADANVGMDFDVQGNGDFLFSSGSFGRTNFKIYGSDGQDFLVTDAITGAPYIGAEGLSADVDVQIIPKGNGRVRFGQFAPSGDMVITGYIEIKDAAGNIRKLATID